MTIMIANGVICFIIEKKRSICLSLDSKWPFRIELTFFIHIRSKCFYVRKQKFYCIIIC